MFYTNKKSLVTCLFENTDKAKISALKTTTCGKTLSSNPQASVHLQNNKKLHQQYNHVITVLRVNSQSVTEKTHLSSIMIYTLTSNYHLKAH